MVTNIYEGSKKAMTIFFKPKFPHCLGVKKNRHLQQNISVFFLLLL
jgi:hypothetical protein